MIDFTMNPPEHEVKTLAQRSKEASERRVVLSAGNCDTFVFAPGRDPSIICLCCGMRSYNQNDIEQRYCGFCKQFHYTRKAVT